MSTAEWAYTILLNNVVLGRIKEAQEWAQVLLKKSSGRFNIEGDRKSTPYRYPEHNEKQPDAFRKAGIPEHPPKPNA